MRRRRPMDWVVQGETYGRDSQPYSMEPWQAVDEGEILILPLTMHDDINSFSAARQPQLEQTVLRSRGTIQWQIIGMDPDAPAVGRWLCHLTFRIVVTTQEPFTPTPSQDTALQYDTRRPEVANDDFLWEATYMNHYFQSFWTTQFPTTSWLLPQRVEVDVRVQRRLRQREVLALVIQASCQNGYSGGGAPAFTASPDLRLIVEPAFRTLVRTNT